MTTTIDSPFLGLPPEQVTWMPCPTWCSGKHHDELHHDGSVILSRCHFRADTEMGYWDIGRVEHVQPDGSTCWGSEPDVTTNLECASGAETCRAIARELLAIADILEAEGFTD